MADETEVIRHQMEDTRTRMTEKLEKLEDKVVTRVQDTTEAVAKTVETVQNAVEDTVKAVSGTAQEAVDTVKQTFDLRRQMHNHPWLMFGGAVGVGFVGGLLLGRVGRREEDFSTPPAYTPEPARPYAAAPGEPPRQEGHSWLGGLTEQLAPAFDKLRGLAVGATTGLIGEMIVKAVPEALKDQVNDVVSQFTTSLGGTPVHGLLEGHEKEKEKETHV
jgi:ElaB/YqjD/DUF883 family membrane-anchored ribosome-binding protein